MLVLSRRPNEKIVFPSIQTAVQVVSVKQGVVRLGIEAPESVPVYREEVLERIDLPQQTADQADEYAAAALLRELTHQVNNRLNASTIGLALLRRQLELGRTREMAVTLDKIDQEVEALRQQVDRVAEERARAPGRRRALLVEDDRNECELLAGFLRLAGLEVETAGDGADALDYLRTRERPDVVLLDMILPRCDGPTTVKAIRRDPTYTGLKIFGVTGLRQENFGLARGPDGIDRWFRKPLNPETLLRELCQELNVSP